MRTVLRQWVVPVVGGVVVAVALVAAVVYGLFRYVHSSSTIPDAYSGSYEHHEDPALKMTEIKFIHNLSRGHVATILSTQTDGKRVMRGVLDTVAGRPSHVVRLYPGDDSTGEEDVLIRCTATLHRRITFTWQWDDGWRASPDYVSRRGRFVQPAGCR